MFDSPLRVGFPENDDGRPVPDAPGARRGLDPQPDSAAAAHPRDRRDEGARRHAHARHEHLARAACADGDRRVLREARSARRRPQPGDVRRRDLAPSSRRSSRSSSCLSGATASGFSLQISLWLWFTVLFANFAEAMAEARGKAQADTLRATKKETPARVLRNAHEETISSSGLRRGDLVLVRENEIVPSDGEVIEGVAYVNEAAITGESAPVLKEPGTDIRSTVTGGTQVVSDWLKIRISADPGEDLPRPHDPARRRGQAPENPQRDRAVDPALGADHRVLARGCHAPAVRDLLRRPGSDGDTGRPPRLPDPDDDRRLALGDRNRGHGPRDALQRARHVRPRSGSGRRRGHAAARQDRHHHLRKPVRRRDHAGGWRLTDRCAHRRPPVEPGRRDARGAIRTEARRCTTSKTSSDLPILLDARQVPSVPARP